MSKLLQSFLKINNKNLLFYKLSNKVKLINYRQINHLNEDSFGIGSKYAELDSVKSNRKFPKKSQAIKSDEDDPDTFGTLSNELDDIEFNTSNNYTKLPSENKPEDEKIEKKYDKILNHIRLSNEDRKNTEEYYGKKINRLASEGKIKEAIDVFFIDMIEKDRFKPTIWLYKILMKHLTELGYTHMVFTLFKKLTSSNEDDWTRSMNKLQKIITLLFYACSKSPWPEYSIKKCDSIRIYLKNRQITPNRQNYCAMILAYGKAGAIYEAFNVVDEMIENKILPDQEIINNLLCACISQPSYGFRYALITWQMALKFKIKPDLIMFNLILKAASECNLNEQKKSNYFKNLTNKKKPTFGNDNKNFFPKSSEEYKTFSDEVYQNMTDSNSNIDQNTLLIKDEISKINNQTLKRFENSKDLIEESQNNVINLTPEDVHVIDEISIAGKSLENQIKNLEWWQDIKTNIDKTSLMEGLTKFRPDLRDVILTQSYESLLTKINENIEKEIFEFVTTEQDTPEGRLSLLGGVEGFLKSMNFHKVEPDFKTFNLIVQKLLPKTLNDEIDLIERMKHYKLKPDITFINFLIKRRTLRKDLNQANSAFDMLQEYQISPNILTFGCLAYQVDSVELLEKFLNDLTNMNFKLNPVIIGILFYKGCWAKNIGYMKYLFDYIIENDVKIDEKLKNKIEYKINQMMLYIVEKEKKSYLDEREEYYYNKTRRFYNSLKKLHEDWIEKVKIESEKHPYEKFARENDELYENFIRNTQKYEISDKYKHSNN